ncbi:MAG: hypothetical protein WBB28_18725 [Crinalium sp.]
MSPSLQFRKVNFFLSEEVTQHFLRESVYDSIKSLLRETDQRSSDYIEKYFENIPLKYLHIDASQLEKIIPEFDKHLKFPLFDPKRTTFFMVDPEIWAAIQKIALDRIKDIVKAEDPTKVDWKKFTGISSEYSLLENLMVNKLLFVNIFG